MGRALFLATAIVVLAACSPKPKAASPPPSGGTSYSTTPCSDNCGRDASCISQCQGVSNQQPLPAGFITR